MLSILIWAKGLIYRMLYFVAKELWQMGKIQSGNYRVHHLTNIKTSLDSFLGTGRSNSATCEPTLAKF